jgi:hypothetical protein
MIDLEHTLEQIGQTRFFGNLGKPDIHDPQVIFIASVEAVFVTPSDQAFQGLYDATQWLPTSPGEDDPYYPRQETPKALSEQRMALNRAVMAATRTLDKAPFTCRPHDFSEAARGGAAYAFRQYATEQFFGLGDHWRRVVDLYLAGHWPVGHAPGKLIVI